MKQNVRHVCCSQLTVCKVVGALFHFTSFTVWPMRNSKTSVMIPFLLFSLKWLVPSFPLFPDTWFFPHPLVHLSALPDCFWPLATCLFLCLFCSWFCPHVCLYDLVVYLYAWSFALWKPLPCLIQSLCCVWIPLPFVSHTIHDIFFLKQMDI